MNTRLAIVGGLAIGAVVGGIARGQQTSRIPISKLSSRPPTHGTVEGFEPLIGVELEPSAVLKDATGEALEYQLSLAPRSGSTSAVAIRYSVEVIGDDGSQLQMPSFSQVIAVAASSGHGKQLVTPVSKRDGYFLVRVQAAGSDGTEVTLQIAERYFRVKGGSIIPVTADEYFQSSNAGLARTP